MAWDSHIDLIALGIDLGFAALFYKLYRNRCESEIQIKKAPHYTTIGKRLYDDIVRQGSIPYACVEGVVQPVHQADTLKSRFGDDVGTIRHSLFTEHKSKRQSGYWVDHKRNIKDYIDKIPFKIENASDSNYALLVEQPLSAHYIEDELKVTYDNYESTNPSILKRGLERIYGEVTKGFQEKERMLTIGTGLLGVGRISTENGKYILEPPMKGEKYILTRMSKKELLNSLSTGTRVLKVLCWICGGIAVGLAMHYVYKKYTTTVARWREEEVYNDIRERTRQMQAVQRENDNTGDNDPTIENDNNDNDTDANNMCVVCLDNERNVVLLNCGHICLCVDCAEALPVPKKCPVCRGFVSRVVATYMS